MSAFTVSSERSGQGIAVVSGSTEAPTKIVRLQVTGPTSYDTGGSALDVSGYGTYVYGVKLAGRTTIGNIGRKFEPLIPASRAAGSLKIQVADASGAEVLATTALNGEVLLVDVEVGA